MHNYLVPMNYQSARVGVRNTELYQVVESMYYASAVKELTHSHAEEVSSLMYY